MTTYAIGDIHGCLDQLERIVRTVLAEDLHPTFIFVGDYIDRGNNSKGVIDYLLRLSQDVECIFLMGNHEDMMLWYLGIEHTPSFLDVRPGDSTGDFWIQNGGTRTMNSYGIDLIDFYRRGGDRECLMELLPSEHLDFLKNLSYYHVLGRNLFVHAGVSAWGLGLNNPEDAARASDPKDLLWDRESFRWNNSFGTMIYGHTVSKHGVRWGNHEGGQPPFSIGIDVGAVFGCNPLVALKVEDYSVIQPNFDIVINR